MLGRGLVLWRVHRIDPGRYVVGNCDAALQKVTEFRLMMKSMGTSVRRVWLAGLIAVAAALTFASGAFAHGSPATLSARGSVEQVQVTGATPGDQVDLLAKGQVVDSKPAGELGGVVFRKVEPGGGYTVSSNGTTSAKLKVLTARSAPPSTDIYDQDLEDGYGYLTTRDGTKLAIDVHLPGPPEDGPYPTLVEYSGYGYANPAGPQSGIQPVAALLGYAVVDINMRGTGCSGGAFDYFETLQSLDGYDAIETVANQPWVLHNKVGMLGISYGGISQLFVAATRPPSLAAITPLSVIDNTQTTLYPGGILNTGFALEWAQDRVDDSQPASPTTGQGVGLGPDRGRRHGLCGQPGSASRGHQPAGEDPPQQVLPAEGRRSAVADQVRPQDRRAGLPRLPVDRRADRRPLPGDGRRVHRHEPQVVHVHQRRPHRFARPGDVQPLVRLHADLRRQAEARDVGGRSRPLAPVIY